MLSNGRWHHATEEQRIRDAEEIAAMLPDDLRLRIEWLADLARKAAKEDEDGA